ncbi:MAG TPA: flagellar biosynthesis anti-sigma factor FlgM [Terriglobales bacterium]|nr:flagellar biosynthesis anti-sigma factor FlgM [Terriglobales bacterium]
MMKIDVNAPTLGGVTPAQDNNKAERTSADPPTTPEHDRATLSTDEARIEGLANQALASSPVRQDKIETLRQAIQRGEYRVDLKKSAEAMIQEAS